MKFLVTHEFIQGMNLTHEEEVKVFEETSAWIDKHLQSGKCLEIYINASTYGIVSIWNMDTVEEGMLLGLDFPLRRYTSVKAVPLLEKEGLRKLLQSAIK